MLAAALMGEQGLELYAKNLEFLSEETTIQHLQRPAPATSNRTMLDLRIMGFRDYSAPEAKGIPMIVVAPYASDSAVIADCCKGQSETLLANGLDRILLRIGSPPQRICKIWSLTSILPSSTSVSTIWGDESI